MYLQLNPRPPSREMMDPNNLARAVIPVTLHNFVDRLPSPEVRTSVEYLHHRKDATASFPSTMLLP